MIGKRAPYLRLGVGHIADEEAAVVVRQCRLNLRFGDAASVHATST